jgi:hypothetical protein
VAFLLLYRLGEAQLVKLVSPFLLDPREHGGLALTTTQVGFVYGTVGIIALTVGGVLGGLVAAQAGGSRSGCGRCCSRSTCPTPRSSISPTPSPRASG